MLIEAPSARPPPRPEPENVRRVAEQQHR
jgi:hypothetical protein